jgi:hypothetical protein
MNPTGIKLSVVVAAFAGVLFAGAYVYKMWAAEMKRRDETPVESVGAIVRDLRRYHARFGRFPENFRELDGTIWPAKPREITKNSQGLHHRHYFYIYARTTNHTFQLWAIPTGPHRVDFPMWLLYSSPTSARKWKGATASLNQFANLKLPADHALLEEIALIEQPSSETKGLGAAQ